MTFRPYDSARDLEAVRRIWHETGWQEDDDFDAMDAHLTGARGHVAELNGAAECLVLTEPGTIRYLDADLPMACVAAVTTSHVARRQGFASRLTAKAIAEDVAAGAIVSTLGMFEQGFYDKLGFGSGGYVHRFAFDPSQLRVDPARRPPRRLSVDDIEEIHRNRLARRLGHGGCNLSRLNHTRADVLYMRKRGYGYGYFDGPGGTLSHQVWYLNRGDPEDGPYSVDFMAWNSAEQFLELMGFIRNLAEQVRLVFMRETHGIQLQDLVHRPLHHRRITEKSPYDARMRVAAYWQARINDLAACLSQTHLPGTETLRFNVELRDPIDRYLADEAQWRGVSGPYTITLGPVSSAAPEHDPSLPTLRATINAFTRLWLGVRPATALNITDQLDGPAELLAALDQRLCLPDPQPDWDF